MMAKTPSSGREKAASAAVPACKAPTKAAVMVSRMDVFMPALPRPVGHDRFLNAIETLDGQGLRQAVHGLGALMRRRLLLEFDQFNRQLAVELRQGLVPLVIADKLADGGKQPCHVPQRTETALQQRLGAQGIDRDGPGELPYVGQALPERATALRGAVQVKEERHLQL